MEKNMRSVFEKVIISAIPFSATNAAKFQPDLIGIRNYFTRCPMLINSYNVNHTETYIY